MKKLGPINAVIGGSTVPLGTFAFKTTDNAVTDPPAINCRPNIARPAGTRLAETPGSSPAIYCRLGGASHPRETNTFHVTINRNNTIPSGGTVEPRWPIHFFRSTFIAFSVRLTWETQSGTFKIRRNIIG
jgi:hypothetical protein